MNQLYFIPIIMLAVILYIAWRNELAVVQKLKSKRNAEEKSKMVELAKRFINKDCIIYTFNSQLNGIIKEVGDGAILVDNNGTAEVVNFEFVVRIREYPRKKNGRRKSVVID